MLMLWCKKEQKMGLQWNYVIFCLYILLMVPILFGKRHHSSALKGALLSNIVIILIILRVTSVHCSSISANS